MIKKFEPTPGTTPKVVLANDEGVMEVTLVGKYTDTTWGDSAAGEVRLYFRDEQRLIDWIERALPEAQRQFRQSQDPLSVIMDALEEGMADDEASYEDVAKELIKRLRHIHGVSLPSSRF
jgi:hypothetical protein